ncbi:S8 family serine peptidase [Haloarchaeobius sp. HME9146]|uniref:S8 family serine peptidase n=1 Tax=Haloarchaeobius sp. HME9146 TaxID=2978732 RepID=UPI0021C0B68A|nr:S8 family serine peptidase [Haloarchaeobius sp. HME9146]MCT9095476.1 S8 family serine peptidase [Haloarchaeobius sp. HME9146]
MTHDTLDRRTVLHGLGVLAGSAALPFAGGIGTAAAETDTSTLDDAFDLSGDAPIEGIVVFDSRESMGRLDDLDLQVGKHEYRELPMTYTALTPDQLTTVADWDGVRRIKKAEELEWFTDDSRELTGVDVVQDELGYDGSSVDAVVIDSGFSGPHPDFEGRLESNWQWVDEPLESRDAEWLDLGGSADTDDLGHGTHCSGIIAGDGSASDGQYRGNAPGARLSVYSTNTAVYLPYVVGAWDHMLMRARDPDVDFDPDVVSNSYGVARDVRYNPNDPVNVASWEAFTEGIVPVFAAGNSGPDADTLSRFAKAPHVLCVAATNDQQAVTDFSSRGRTPDEDRETNYDRATALWRLWRYHATVDSGQFLVDVGTWTGEVGPAATTDAQTESDFWEWEAPANADMLELTLDIEPDGEQVRVSVHEGSRDGPVIAQMGEEVVHQHRTLTTDIAGGETYYVEVEPVVSVTVSYTIDYEGIEELGGEPTRYRPVGLYRPGVAIPGDSIMATVGPTDSLDALEPDTEPYYTPMTGTSMACPNAAGVCALVIDAARQNGYDPHPIEVINTVEATARDLQTAYTPWNAGAGFVDAEAAVRRAETGDFARFHETDLVDADTPTWLSVAGSRDDDGSTFTGGQTNEVEVTVGAVSHTAEVRDTVPAEWTVLTEYSPDVRHVEQAGDVQYVHFDATVDPADDARTVRYLVEAPSGSSNTGTYTFGPATARSDETDDEWVAFGGTDDNAVVAEET